MRITNALTHDFKCPCKKMSAFFIQSAEKVKLNAG